MKLNDKLKKRLKAIQQIVKSGGRVEDLFKLMKTHKDLWWLAYCQIYPNKGAMTKGTTSDTLDGFSEQRIDSLRTEVESAAFGGRARVLPLGITCSTLVLSKRMRARSAIC